MGGLWALPGLAARHKGEADAEDGGVRRGVAAALVQQCQIGAHATAGQRHRPGLHPRPVQRIHEALHLLRLLA